MNRVIEVVVYWNETYHIHPNYRTIKQYRSCQIKASVLFVYFLIQEDHDGPISPTWANRFAYLLFQPSSLL